MRKRLWQAGLSVVCGALVVAGCGKGNLDEENRQASLAATQAATMACATETEGWTIEPKSEPTPPTEAPLYEVSTGHTGCYDEIGFNIDTPDPVGYRTEYSEDAVGPDGTQLSRPTGDRLLLVTVSARPKTGLNPGQSIAVDGASKGASSIQGVMFGGQAGNESTFIIGLGTDAPFTVRTDNSGNAASVVVRIARPAPAA